jgi:hypothetical protein
MSYNINKTNGALLVTLLDGTTNTDTGLTLIGRNYISYGEIQNENFVRLLENFASPLPPGQSIGFTPIAGQLWWDTANQRLRVYTGTEFANVSENYVGASAPENSKIGDQWWDTTNKQLKIYDGVTWTLIAPPYTVAQGKSGAIVETATDTSSGTHTVVNTYTNNQLISVSSYDPEFISVAYPQFNSIKPGINLAANVTLNGTTENSLRLGGVFANDYARSNVATSFSSDVSVNGNLVLSNANVSYEQNALVIKNSTLNGNVAVYVTGSFGNTRALNINGATGMITVFAEPTSTFGIATKGYVDAQQFFLNNSIVSNIAAINASIAQLYVDTNLNLTSNVNAINANTNQLRSDTDANTASINNAISVINANLGTATNNIVALQSNAVSQQNQIEATNSAIVLANVQIKDYVDTQDATIYTYVDGQVLQTSTNAQNNLIAGLALKADLNGPALTGTATSETPAPEDNTTKIATTAFVRGAITGNLTRWQGSQYTVSTSPPSGGNNGDFWFQIN